MSNEFVNTQTINEQALYDLAERSRKSQEEEDILRIAEMERSGQISAELLGVEQSVMDPIIQDEIREFAFERADNERFAALYERFFAPKYGPLRRVAVAA
jgi:hypothetical protein